MIGQLVIALPIHAPDYLIAALALILSSAVRLVRRLSLLLLFPISLFPSSLQISTSAVVHCSLLSLRFSNPAVVHSQLVPIFVAILRHGLSSPGPAGSAAEAVSLVSHS